MSLRSTKKPSDKSKANSSSCRTKLMDYLARRDHSELELRKKLARDFTPQEIEQAIADAREEKWLAPPLEQSERVAQMLHNKGKGHFYIIHYLRKKGLPEIPRDPQLETRKAFAIIESRFPAEGAYTMSEKQAIARHLNSRGFDEETIRRIIYEEL